MQRFESPVRWILASILFVLISGEVIKIKAERSIGRGQSPDRGQEVKIFHVPYLVQLRDEEGKLLCTGTLVSTDYVVTAAQCFDDVDYNKVMVVCGAATISEEGTQRAIDEISIHPDYNADTKKANVAVLKMNEPIEFGRNIKKVRLCSDTLSAGELVQTTGWGHMGSNQRVSQKVRSGRIPVAAHEICENEFPSPQERNILCVTGHPGLSHCIADAGGPVIYHGKLCGIIADGDRCMEPYQSSSFTNVLDMRVYIESIINPEDENAAQLKI